MFKFKRLIEEGESAPPMFGIVYRDYSRAQTIIMPIPLNCIVALWLAIYWAFQRRFRKPAWEKALADARWAGFESGLKQGKAEGLREGLVRGRYGE